MYALFCRIYQFAIKIANYFLGYRTPEIAEGEGAVAKVTEILYQEMKAKPLVVSDPRMILSDGAATMLKALADAGFAYAVFTGLSGDPTSADVENGLSVYKENGCDALIVLGGGAPIDLAKAIAARVTRPEKTVRQMTGILKVMKKIPLLIAIPTTAGTGSETTVAAVITDSETHRKAALNDPHLTPAYAVLDPTLTKTMPPYFTVTTGMDALCHAVESYTNHTYNTKLENDYAKEAVRLIYGNLLKAFQNGDDLEARQNMQRAAFYAGRSFTRGCVGYVHAVGHTLGGLYHVPHAEAMASILPKVLRHYGAKAYKRLAELANVCGMEGKDEAEKALKFIEWIESVNEAAGIPKGFPQIEDKDIGQIVEWAVKEANPLYPVPVIWKKSDFETFIHLVKEGK